ATHLLLACVIFVATMLLARSLAPHSSGPALPRIRRLAGWMVLLVLAQIGLGALVAGSHAGMIYNSWPLMEGRNRPDQLMTLQPWWINFFENHKTVQFTHRLGAYLLLAVAAWHAISAWRAEPGSTHARRAVVLFALIVVQAGLGVVTLLSVSQLHLALTH